MAITYNWVIERINVIPELDGKQQVVSDVHWRLVGSEPDENGRLDDKERPLVYKAFVYDSLGVPYDPDYPFTEYSQLTKDQVISWVQNIIGPEEIAAYEKIIETTILKQKTPDVTSPPIPWA